MRTQLRKLIRNHTDEFLADKIICRPCLFANAFESSKKNLILATGTRKYYTLPEEIAALTEAYTHSKFHPFTVMFKVVYTRLVEAGLVNVWLQSSIAKWKLNGGNQSSMLKPDDLFSLWKLVLIGYVISSCVFLVELRKHYIKGDLDI